MFFSPIAFLSNKKWFSGMIEKDLLNELFECRDQGLYWRYKRNNINIGDRVGTITPSGYRSIVINGKRYYEHRIVFFIHHGFFPKEVDHIDGNKLNNNISNLRQATRSQNVCNQKLTTRNKSGVKGVAWNKCSKKWFAQCQVNKKRYTIGLFNDLELAKQKIQHFREKMHGEFARHI